MIASIYRLNCDSGSYIEVASFTESSDADIYFERAVKDSSKMYCIILVLHGRIIKSQRGQFESPKGGEVMKFEITRKLIIIPHDENVTMKNMLRAYKQLAEEELETSHELPLGANNVIEIDIESITTEIKESK